MGAPRPSRLSLSRVSHAGRIADIADIACNKNAGFCRGLGMGLRWTNSQQSPCSPSRAAHSRAAGTAAQHTRARSAPSLAPRSLAPFTHRALASR